VNVGHPVLDEGSRYLAPIADVVWAAHAGDRYEAQKIGYRRVPAPQPRFVEQVWEYEMGAGSQGEVPVAIVNDRIGLGFEVITRKSQLPCVYQWQNFQAGHYALGIEPSTHHAPGNLFARERGEMIWLEHDERRAYDAVFRVLDGAKAIKAAENRITSIARQPDEDFPKPSGKFPLVGRS
jgi:hypothetical protein